jgi:carbonic anhydrase
MTNDRDHDFPVSADDALARLMAGNARFVRSEPNFSHPPREVLANLARGQRPFATILGCSDSRVPPELLFDTAFGELFIIRVAGNVMSPSVAGSIQYAGTHLGTQLFMVLGHEGCGAVQAALAAKFDGKQERSRIQALLQAIVPGLDGIDPQLPPTLQMSCAVEANVRWTLRQMIESPEGRERMSVGHIRIVGAVCDISTGQVHLLDQ